MTKTVMVAVVAAILAASVAGCVSASTVHLTDGSVFPSAEDAVRETASSDLSCSDTIDVKDVSERHLEEYVAVGCGSRVHYRMTYQDGGQAELVELSRSRDEASKSP
jgi:hypothetical protein